MLSIRCIQLTDDGVVPLAEACRRLELLSLHGIQGITDRRVLPSLLGTHPAAGTGCRRELSSPC